MKLDVEVTVQPELKKTLDRFASTPKQLAQALYVEAAPVMADAIRRAPHDSGGLDQTAYITKPLDPVHPVVELGFAAPYAASVHERLDLHHAGGGEAKFLQRALDAGARDLVDRAGRRLANWIEKGVQVDSTTMYPTSPPSTPQHSRGRAKRARAALRRR